MPCCHVAGSADHRRWPAAAVAPHDSRRIFVTDAIRSGCPPQIAAKVCGHSTVDTTMGYAAIYPEDVTHTPGVHHRRRAERPSEEYRDLTAREWDEFLAHFELRKAAPRNMRTRPPNPLRARNACVRCPLLRVDPAQSRGCKESTPTSSTASRKPRNRASSARSPRSRPPSPPRHRSSRRCASRPFAVLPSRWACLMPELCRRVSFDED
jgi:hypothetical protein